MATVSVLVAVVISATLLVWQVIRAYSTKIEDRESSLDSTLSNAAVRDIKSSFVAAVDLIEKRVGPYQKRYDFHWTLVVHETSSEDTLPLKAAGVESLLSEAEKIRLSTLGLSWEITSQGVVMEVSWPDRPGGEALLEEVLLQVKNYRPDLPLDSLVFSVPVTCLDTLSDPHSQLARNLGARLGARISYCRALVSKQLPVHFLFFGIDDLPGFRQFIDKMPIGYRESILGWSNPEIGESQISNSTIARSHWANVAAVRQSLLALASSVRVEDKVDFFEALVGLRTFAGFQTGLLALMAEALITGTGVNSQFRGYYFCGGLQSRDLGLGGINNLSGDCEAWFLRDLFQKRILFEKDLRDLAFKQENIRERHTKLVNRGFVIALSFVTLLVASDVYIVRENAPRWQLALEAASQTQRSSAEKGTGYSFEEVAKLIKTGRSERLYFFSLPWTWPVFPGYEREAVTDFLKLYARDYVDLVQNRVTEEQKLIAEISGKSNSGAVQNGRTCVRTTSWSSDFNSVVPNLQRLYAAQQRSRDAINQLNELASEKNEVGFSELPTLAIIASELPYMQQGHLVKLNFENSGLPIPNLNSNDVEGLKGNLNAATNCALEEIFTTASRSFDAAQRIKVEERRFGDEAQKLIRTIMQGDVSIARVNRNIELVIGQIELEQEIASQFNQTRASSSVVSIEIAAKVAQFREKMALSDKVKAAIDELRNVGERLSPGSLKKALASEHLDDFLLVDKDLDVKLKPERLALLKGLKQIVDGANAEPPVNWKTLQTGSVLIRFDESRVQSAIMELNGLEPVVISVPSYPKLEPALKEWNARVAALRFSRKVASAALPHSDPVNLERDIEQFDRAAKEIGSASLLIRRSGQGRVADRLDQFLERSAIGYLERIDELFEQALLFDAMRDGVQPWQFFAGRMTGETVQRFVSQATPMAYVEDQLSKFRQLVASANRLLSHVSPSSALAQKWASLNLQLEWYESGNPQSALLVLKRLAQVIPIVNEKACDRLSKEVDPSFLGASVFSSLTIASYESIVEGCENLLLDEIKRTRNLLKSNVRRVQSSNPFSLRNVASEASPEDVSRIVDTYFTFSSKSDKPYLQKAWPELAEAGSSMPMLQQLLRSRTAVSPLQLDLEVRVSPDREKWTNQIAHFSISSNQTPNLETLERKQGFSFVAGDSLHLRLRLADDSKFVFAHASKNSKTPRFYEKTFSGIWALPKLLNELRSISPALPGSVTYLGSLSLPIVHENGGQPVTEMVLSLKITLADSSGTALELPGRPLKGVLGAVDAMPDTATKTRSDVQARRKAEASQERGFRWWNDEKP